MNPPCPRRRVGQWLALWLLAAITVLGVRPSWAQSAPTAATEDLLQSIIVRIQVRTPLGTGLCHGFVADVRGNVAYIVTAKHCVADLSPATIQRQAIAPDLAITIAYANGGTGTGTTRGIYWHPAQDDLVIAASFDRRPASYAERCPTCTPYFTLQPTTRPIPVLSMLSSAGGMPELSSGMVFVTESGDWIVLLPTAPGTSGAPVLELRGNLVGIVSSATIIRGTEAGVMVELVPGGLATDLVGYTIGKVERAAAPPSPPPPPLPTSHAPASRPPTTASTLPPGISPGTFTGVVREAGPMRDLNAVTITLDSGGELPLSSTIRCPLQRGDRVLLSIHPDHVVVFAGHTVAFTCTMRVTGP